jgi:hypothetical protein
LPIPGLPFFEQVEREVQFAFFKDRTHSRFVVGNITNLVAAARRSASGGRNGMTEFPFYGAESGIVFERDAGDLEIVGPDFVTCGLVDGPVEILVQNGPPVRTVRKPHRCAGVLGQQKQWESE